MLTVTVEYPYSDREIKRSLRTMRRPLDLRDDEVADDKMALLDLFIEWDLVIRKRVPGTKKYWMYSLTEIGHNCIKHGFHVHGDRVYPLSAASSVCSVCDATA